MTNFTSKHGTQYSWKEITHFHTMSENANDHTTISFAVPPVDWQLSINIRHFHQQVTDDTQQQSDHPSSQLQLHE